MTGTLSRIATAAALALTLAAGTSACTPGDDVNGTTTTSGAVVTAGRGEIHPALADPVRKALEAARATAAEQHLNGPLTTDSAEFRYHADRWSSGSNDPGATATGDHIVYVTQKESDQGDRVELEIRTHLARTVGGQDKMLLTTWAQQAPGRRPHAIGSKGFSLVLTADSHGQAHALSNQDLILGTDLRYGLPQPSDDVRGRYREVTGGGAGTPAEVRARLTSSKESFLKEARAQTDDLERKALARVDQADPPCLGTGCYGGPLSESDKVSVRARVKADFAARRTLIDQHGDEVWAMVKDSLRWDLL